MAGFVTSHLDGPYLVARMITGANTSVPYRMSSRSGVLVTVPSGAVVVMQELRLNAAMDASRTMILFMCFSGLLLVLRLLRRKLLRVRLTVLRQHLGQFGRELGEKFFIRENRLPHYRVWVMEINRLDCLDE